MQLTDVFCYILLAITICASYAQAEPEQNGLLKNKSDKRISKREAAIFIDSYPMEPMYKHRPKVIYRRVSKQRYKSPKPKYGPPIKYRSVKPWTPSKKYRRTVKPKYGPPSYKRYPTKPKYGPPKSSHKPIYGPPKKMPFGSFYPPEPIGFGEPPINNVEYQPPRQSFGEPPVDSYGEPVNAAVNDPYIPEQYSPQVSNYPDIFAQFGDFGQNFGQDYKSWQSFQSDQNLNFDNNVAYSKRRPIYVKPDQSFVIQNEDFDLNSHKLYSHKYKNKKVNTEQEPLPFEKKVSNYSNKRTTTKPRRLPKTTTPEPEEEEEEVLVGGRYAEPPERYVPKLPIAQYSSDDDFKPLRGYNIDPDVAISATMSPYVNYKNSNMAFSPQNLNDAFSIVDK